MSVSEPSEPSVRPSASAAPPPPRPSGRSHAPASPLARIGFALFGIGLLAVMVILVLFATGNGELPLWLNLLALLAPVGFGLGLLGVYLEARSSRTAARPVSTRLDTDGVERSR